MKKNIDSGFSGVSGGLTSADQRRSDLRQINLISLDEILKKIDKTAKEVGRNITLMELCGTHTEAVARFGIKKLLPQNVKMLSGPGCPVCVTSQEDIDAIITLALAGIPIATYGDVLRVPGTLKMSNVKCQMSNISLDKAREMGANVRAVYSIEEALELQKRKPNLVFFGIGFETTTPMTAYAIKKGLTVFSAHKLFLPAMKTLVEMGEIKIDGFINPGHVSTIIGMEPYKKIKNQKSKIKMTNKNSKINNLNNTAIPQVIAGFEANDVLIAIYMLLKQIKENRAEVENEYRRSVKPDGNPAALRLINEVFDVVDSRWRGFGVIPKSGLEIKKKYQKFDARVKYKDILSTGDWRLATGKKQQMTGNRQLATSDGRRATNTVCRCGEILRGLKEPKDCKLFNKKCTPENPVGACMVSSEGACGIEAKFKN